MTEDILEPADQENLDGILSAEDKEKAFDSVEHNYIFSMLKKFGFGPDFLQWVKTTFCNVQSCVVNNGNSTGYLSLERGTRQGDPLSHISLYMFWKFYSFKLVQIKRERF